MRFLIDTAAAMVTGFLFVVAFPAAAAGATADVEHHAPASIVVEAPEAAVIA